MTVLEKEKPSISLPEATTGAVERITSERFVAYMEGMFAEHTDEFTNVVVGSEDQNVQNDKPLSYADAVFASSEAGEVDQANVFAGAGAIAVGLLVGLAGKSQSYLENHEVAKWSVAASIGVLAGIAIKSTRNMVYEFVDALDYNACHEYESTSLQSDEQVSRAALYPPDNRIHRV